MKKIETKHALGTGFVSGVLGSLCCVTPLVLVLLGFSGVSGAMALAGTLQQNFRWLLFIPLGVLFLGGSIYVHLKRKEGVCNLNTIKQYKYYVIITILFTIAIWILLIYAIVPAAFALLS
jgi:hypothetical protein